MYLSKNYIWIHYFYFALIISSAYIILFKLPESPKYLVSKKKYEEAQRVFALIAKYNGKIVMNPQLELFKEEVLV